MEKTLNTILPPKPTGECWCCHNEVWWLRRTQWGPPQWLCGRCHPWPPEDNKQVTFAGMGIRSMP